MIDPDEIDVDYLVDLTDAQLGTLARDALLASRFIGPDHPDWDRVGAYLKQDKVERLEGRF